MLLALAVASAAMADPLDLPGDASDWVFSGGEWEIADGALSQLDPWVAESSFEQTGHAFLKSPAFSDFELRFEFQIGRASCRERV